MRRVADYGHGIEIWYVASEYFVYGVRDGGDPVICPSESMARDVAASGLTSSNR